jgi:hypothetical protein
MNIYLAGAPGGGSVGLCKRERQLNRLWKLRLWSYYHLTIINGKMPEVTNKKVELFLDSGAFSAWSQGKTIDINEYIDFIKEHKKVIDVYANLDVIGDAQATWKNQVVMEKAGLHPLPVFHFGEDMKWLIKMLEKDYDYIGLGGMVPISTTNLYHWLDDLFTNYLTDKYGIPIVKIHGFGLTSLRLMLRYPWYSVDSTSWVLTGRMGAIFVPKFRGKDWIYNDDPWKINVSNKSPDRKEAGKHITTMSPMEKRILLDYINDKGYKLGKSDYKIVSPDYELAENEKWSEKKSEDKRAKREVEIITEAGVSNRYQLRDEMNILYFLDLEKSMPKWPWPFKKKEAPEKGFFD